MDDAQGDPSARPVPLPADATRAASGPADLERVVAPDVARDSAAGPPGDRPSDQPSAAEPTTLQAAFYLQGAGWAIRTQGGGWHVGG